MVQGQVLGGADTCPIKVFHGLSFLHSSEITLLFAKLCYAFEEKLFFCHHNFMKKGHSTLRCLKMNLKIFCIPLN